MLSLKNIFIGKKIFQPFFEKMYRISLRGMNYGLGGMVETSGELNVMDFIKKMGKSDSLILFDIGANNGQYLSFLKSKFEKNCRIYVFEPGKLCFQNLKKTFIQKNIYISNIAVSSLKGSSQLYYGKEGSPWASLYNNSDIIERNSEEIETTTLDDFCREEHIHRINFCKIDVEGHELEVLKGAKTLLNENKIDFIQFEFGYASLNAGIYLKNFFDCLHNYDIYRIVNDGLYKISYNVRYEIFLTSNYLAINKNLSMPNN